MTSYRWAASVLLGGCALILLPATAHASPPTETKTIEVRAEYTEPMPQFDGVECRGFEASAPSCQAIMAGAVTFTGTIAGEAWAESGGPTTDGHTYDGPDVFEHAVVAGCGEGGLILDTFAGEFDFKDTHPDDVSTGSSNDWRIRPGSGTGTLAGISGQGENHWRPYWTETGERWGRGVYTGTITCEVPVNERRREPEVATAAAASDPPVGVSGVAYKPAGEPSVRALRAPASAADVPTIAILGATSEPAGGPPRAGGPAAAVLAGVGLLGAGLVGRRLFRA